MKHAYVSLLISASEAPSADIVAGLDAMLASQTRLHEIVFVLPFAATPGDYSAAELSGPVTVITTHLRATPDSAAMAGLSRAVGDFVIDWRGDISDLSGEVVAAALTPTDAGSELVEMTGVDHSAFSRFFYRTVNGLRPRAVPVRKTVGRVYSRHAIGQLLDAAAFEPQIDVLSAELPVHRSVVAVAARTPHREALVDRIADGASLLSKGTRFGSIVPLGLSAVAALFGIGVAVYALGIFLLRGQTPEGWTTLMVVTGLGLAAMLALLGLVWTRIDAIARGMARRRDATGVVYVTPPTRES